ncbi:MAG: acetate--CoA ligase family protein [Pseudomonadota bacterium]
MNQESAVSGSRVRAFLKPRSIAIIGASGDENKIGGRPIRYLRLAGYKGPVFPINPGRDVVQGLKSYPSLADVDAEVDLVVIAVPAQDVLAAVQACVAKGVNGAMVFSSGFAEVDDAGRALQDQIVATARQGGVALLGPNCAGTFNVREGLLATFTSGIIDRPPRIGSIGMVSQSGAFGIHMIVLAAERDLGLSMCLTTGNQSDVDVSEALAYIVEDDDTDVVVLVVEGVVNPARLLAAFEAARLKRKPVIVLKLGRSEAGAKAAASHTASLAGSDEIFDSILRQSRVYRAHSIDELMDVAYACSLGRLPANDKVGLITVSGGVGILMADQAEALGLDVAEMPAESQAAIKALLPFSAARNPVDVTAQVITHPQLVGPMFEHLLSGGGYGSAVCFITHIARNKELFGKLLPHFEEVGRKHTDRFLALSTLAGPETRRQIESIGYALFEDPARALRAIKALVRFREAFDAPAAEAAPALPAGADGVRAGASYDESEAKKILAAAGIPCAAEQVVCSAQAAVDAAHAIGFPLVMKIVSPDIQHKSEIGGVLLNLTSFEEVRSGYATLIDRAQTHAPHARITGVLLAQQVKGGVETILGVSRDPVFGPVVMFGLGGVFVEVLKDVAFRRAPFGPSEARRMIREVKGYAMLQGVRGAPAADEEALVQAITQLSAFAAAQGDALESIDINPFIVLPRGQGALAVDALIETRPG